MIKGGTPLESTNVGVPTKLSFEAEFLLVFDVFEPDFCKFSFDIILENFDND